MDKPMEFLSVLSLPLTVEAIVHNVTHAHIEDVYLHITLPDQTAQVGIVDQIKHQIQSTHPTVLKGRESREIVFFWC